MCMSKIDKLYKGKGYKVVHNTKGELYPVFQNSHIPFSSTAVNVAIMTRNIDCNDGQSHMSGYHVFKNLKGAEKYHLRQGGFIYEIEYFGIIAEGWQDGCKTIITPAFKFVKKIE